MQSDENKLQDIIDTVNDNQKKMDRLQAAEMQLLRSDTLPELFQYLFNEYPKHFQLYSVELLLIDDEYGIHRLLEDSGQSTKSLHCLQLITDSERIHKIHSIDKQPALAIYDRDNHRWLHNHRIPEPASIAILPLIRHHETIGVATCVSQDVSRYAPSDGTEFLQRLSSILAISIENAVNYHRLQYLGLTDPLTGARNRRFLDQRIIEEVANACRTQDPLSFLFLDIDHFKQVNDTYGHQTGDEVLHEVAHRANLQLRSNDVLARYGGEEFAILLSNTDVREAEQIAERIRQVIQDEPFSGDSQQLSVTASIGIAQLTPPEQQPADHQTLANQLTQSADEALYKAKEGGRNRIVIAAE